MRLQEHINNVIASGTRNQKGMSERKPTGNLEALNELPEAPKSTEKANKGDSENKGDEMELSRYFMHFLQEVKTGFLVTCYKSNLALSIGMTNNKEKQPMLSMWMTNLVKPMSAAVAPSGDIWVGEKIRMSRFSRVNQPFPDTENPERNDFDAYYLPRECRVTSDIDIHDIVVTDEGKPFFVSATFCCVCTTSEQGSMKVVWKPNWISKIAAEDRCHLNGLCLHQNRLKYCTAVSRTDVASGWRTNRRDGGVVWDIENDCLVTKGLSMPHSPRVHDGKLWVLESGSGHFGYVDFDTIVDKDGDEPYRPFVRKAFIPGFLRGLCFAGNYAIVGSSLDRHERVFQNLELGERLAEQNIPPKCGIFVVNLKTFDVVHHLTFGSNVVELYDVVAIPGAIRPRVDESRIEQKFIVEDEEGELKARF